ncbi:MAG: ComEC/Rec2 family competence protein, partial [Chlamydiia bacterium]|nr:ComEC/Rec2 family competence protein [Chlamydiia bacterium]
TTSISVAKNIRITFSLKKPVSMASIYTVHGTLIPPNRWISKNKWEMVAKQLPIGKWRFLTKRAIKQWIHSSYPSERVYQLLSGLATGEFDDRELSFHFARFGLQHLMAISGFHFGILAYFLQRFLSLFLTWRQSSYAATLVLSLYCLFVGRYPSVIRAWIAISLCLTGLLLHKRSSALNALGLGLLVLMLYDPLSCRSLGFQFSFAVTASILCFYRPMEQLTCHLLPRRSWYAKKQLSTSDQLLCPLLNFLRSGIALGLSVYLVALPMTLCFFHTIPLLSFIYNLFMPFCISVSLFLLLLSWLPGITSLNNSITDWILGLAYHVPTTYDFSIHCTTITPPTLILYLTLLYTYALHKKSNNNLIMQI